LDEFGGLLRWPELNDWIESQANIPGEGPITAVQRLPGGSQNCLFLLTRTNATCVLRRPPLNKRKQSDEIMIREARLLAGIGGTAVPHAQLYASCSDLNVVGAAFYVMAALDGFSPLGQLPGQYAENASWREAMGVEYIKAGVALGSVDYKARGLELHGKAENWHGRQVERWLGQLESYESLPGYRGHELPHIAEISRWLADHVPSDGQIGIIHGDFQFPNVMYCHDKPVIAGLIDWELSTLGDPLLDLGWLLTSWWDPADPPGKTPACTPWNGFLPRRELIALYGDLAGRDMSQMPWYTVLAAFKLACILEGNYARSVAGQMAAETGRSLHRYALLVLEVGRHVMEGGLD